MPSTNPSPVGNHLSNKFFVLSLGLINVLAFTLLICGLSFLMGISVSGWQFPLACVLALVVNYYVTGFFMGVKKNQSFLRSSGIILALLVGLVLFCGFFYDVSYDGQWYHQETIYRLQQGYNPARQTISPAPDEETGDVSTGFCMGADRPALPMASPGSDAAVIKYLVINNFSKGSEIIEAAVYKTTNRIEAGKAVNGIFLFAAFFLCLSLLYKIDRIGVRKKWLMAVLITFNPITLMQLNTFCVDGNVACSLVCLLAVSALIWGEITRPYLLLLGSLIMVVVSIKLTAIAFAGGYCIVFLAVLLIYKKMDAFKRVLRTGILAGAIGFVCCSYNPFISNFVNYHDVLYGVAKDHKTIQNVQPPLFRNLNRIQTLFFSLSAHQGWKSADKSSVWEIPKIPFTFNKQDIKEAKDAQQQFSAFGPFFSGALLIAVALWVFTLVYYFVKKKVPREKSQSFLLLNILCLVTLVSVLSFPEAWWGRYVPHFWLFPLIILCIGELLSFRGERLFKGLLYLALGLNVAWASLNIVSNLSITARLRYQMQQMKAIGQPVIVEYCPYDTFKSNGIRLVEEGIPTIEKNVTGPYVYNIIESNTRFETPVPLPDLPKSWLLRLTIKLTGNE